MSDTNSQDQKSQSPFFVDGGSLQPQTPSYVTRPADQDLLQHILDGEFCYVLTARQMGKSSLMVRTAQSLQEQKVKIAIVDLTIIGTVITIKQWYLGLLRLIQGDLNLQTDASAWWREHEELGEPQRFFEFLRDVVLREVDGTIAIFIDEIDTTLNLEFRDDFFAAIRAMYNARANNPMFNRLTFILLGVATPTDLIKDQKRTPFNIGTRVVLQGFSYHDAKPLLRGVERSYPGQGDRILKRIFYWTNGHPYLTQKLCLAVTNSHVQQWNDDAIDQLVESNFFGENARADSNLAFVESRIQDTPQDSRQRMLDLYDQVYSGKFVANDDRSQVQNYLELFGLVRVETNKLLVSNRIYQYVFDSGWILKNKPVETPPSIPGVVPNQDSIVPVSDDVNERSTKAELAPAVRTDLVQADMKEGSSDVVAPPVELADTARADSSEDSSDALAVPIEQTDFRQAEASKPSTDVRMTQPTRARNMLEPIAFAVVSIIVIVVVVLYILAR